MSYWLSCVIIADVLSTTDGTSIGRRDEGPVGGTALPTQRLKMGWEDRHSVVL